MEELLVIYRCPSCKGRLAASADELKCCACRKHYHVYLGIPNFKEGELYPGEHEILLDVCAKYPGMDFVSLLEYLDSQPQKNVLPWELRRFLRYSRLDEAGRRQCLADYKENTIRRPGEVQLHISRVLAEALGHQFGGRCLDVGCGRGPWAVAAAAEFTEVFALDMDMASVIIAQKYCEEHGIKGIRFLSAMSWALPFEADYFDLVNSQAVLEHVADQEGMLREINRVLKPSGCFTGDSVNRFNALTPEPHINLRFVGFLPKHLAHRLSLWLKGFPYDDIKPLSYPALHKLLQKAFGNNYRIIPFIETPEKSLTQTVMRYLPNGLLNYITHTHYIAAGKRK